MLPTNVIAGQDGHRVAHNALHLVYNASGNARSYGAIGNGLTDDTQAIQSAINAASAGTTIYIPTGNYRITNTILLKSGVNVVSGGAVIDSSSLHDIAFSCRDLHDIEISGLSFVGPADRQPPDYSVAISMSDSDGYSGAVRSGYNINVHHCKFYGYWFGGVRIDGHHNRVDNNYFSEVNSKKLNAWGSVIQTRGHFNEVSHNYIVDSLSIGIELMGDCHHCKVLDNLIWLKSGWPGYEGGQANGNGIIVQDQSWGGCRDILVHGNTVANTDAEGIAVQLNRVDVAQNINDVRITENYLYNCNFAGITINCCAEGVGKISNVVISGNNIYLDSLSPDGNPYAYHGILATGIAGCVISHNTIASIVDLQRGITVTSQYQPAENITVSDNIVGNCSIHGIWTYAYARTLAHISITNNMVSDCRTGICVERCSYAGITGNHTHRNAIYGVEIGEGDSVSNILLAHNIIDDAVMIHDPQKVIVSDNIGVT